MLILTVLISGYVDAIFRVQMNRLLLNTFGVPATKPEAFVSLPEVLISIFRLTFGLAFSLFIKK